MLLIQHSLRELTDFKKDITQTMEDLNQIKPAPGFSKVLYPGQNNDVVIEEYKENGIEIVDDIYEYLKSDVVHNNQYDNKNPFAEVI